MCCQFNNAFDAIKFSPLAQGLFHLFYFVIIAELQKSGGGLAGGVSGKRAKKTSVIGRWKDLWNILKQLFNSKLGQKNPDLIFPAVGRAEMGLVKELGVENLILKRIF